MQNIRLNQFRRLTANDIRNLISFWCFGLGNNFSYVIMLAAALDIIQKQEPHSFRSTKGTFHHNCTETGTASVLLADIIPSMTVKLVAPLFIHRLHFHLKILLSCALALNSFLMVSFSTSMTMSIIGIISASLSCGIGDVSFLSMTAFFSKNCVSSWSSGTGAAGLIGALSYAALTSILPPEKTLLLLTVVPISLVLVYFFLLARPNHPKFQITCWSSQNSINPISTNNYGSLKEEDSISYDGSNVRGVDRQLRTLAPRETDEYEVYVRDSYSSTNFSLGSSQDNFFAANPEDAVDLQQQHPSFKDKLNIIKGLSGLLIFLSLVYFFEYMINQSLFELLIFTNTISEAEQYRWYQVLYQTGVFVSRSSVNVIHFRRTWAMAVLQALNFVLCLTQVIYRYIPYIWIMFVIILYEGCLGGLSYVNTFYRIIQETTPAHREYAMAFATISDSIGITLAGLLAIALRNWLCKLVQ